MLYFNFLFNFFFFFFRVTVCFDDGTGELDVPIDEVITLQLFQKGQRVSVKLPDGYYYDGEIYASDVYGLVYYFNILRIAKL